MFIRDEEAYGRYIKNYDYYQEERKYCIEEYSKSYDIQFYEYVEYESKSFVEKLSKKHKRIRELVKRFSKLPNAKKRIKEFMNKWGIKPF